MTTPSHPSIATLFGELLELPPSRRAERLGALEQTAPALARELAALLEADREVGDFLGVLRPSSPREADAEWPSAGARVGPYEVVRRLGAGGMGTVWLAHDSRLDRPLALKFLHAGSAAGPLSPAQSAGTRARFLTEARAAAALDHPHIAAVYDVGEAPNGRLYIAMAYCHGGSLADRLVAGPLAPVDAVRVGSELAAALGAAHARGVVHRDVKPANVLFDAAGAVRLADFGIAKLVGQDATASGVFLGTLSYLAPEQLRGEQAAPAADLWALGVTLYEALAGRRPFEAESPAALMHAILHGEPAALPATIPAPVSTIVRALLSKDPARRPVSAEAAARALLEAAAAASQSARAPLPASLGALPATLTPFVGRGRELAEVVALLERTRLLTLTGLGGAGKTRLALAAAVRSAERQVPGAPPADAPSAIGADRPVVWVDLTAVAESTQVAGHIAAALGVPERPEAAPLTAAGAALGAAPVLLVLDNCEHVVNACAAAVDRLLRACPGLRVLATSREPLSVTGETVYQVPPLALDEARQLFVDRARSAQPAFSVTGGNAAAVDEICRRLDGLPLALELAAARVRVLTPAQIAVRLDQAFRLLAGRAGAERPQHRTLRGTMDWSHALLAPREQALLRRLAVFAGGFSLEAAEAVVPLVDDGHPRAAVEAGDVLDGLSALVDRSLVVMDAGGAADQSANARFRLLETVRQYAAERLEAAGESDAARAAHATFFVSFAERAEPHLFAGAGDAAWVGRVRADAANLRATAAWAAEPHARAERAEVALRIGAAVNWLWFVVGQYEEARQRLTAALAAGESADPLLRGRALTALAFLATWQGDAAAALAAADSAVALLRGHAEPLVLATALVAASAGHVLSGDPAAAGRAADEAIAVARALPPHPVHSLALYWQGWGALARGEPSAARAAFEGAAENGRRIGHPPAVAHPRAMLGRLALDAGDLVTAADHYVASLAVHASTDDTWGLAVGLEGMARVAAMQR